jgi:hypothetical protein
MVRNSTRRMGNDRENSVGPHLKLSFEQPGDEWARPPVVPHHMKPVQGRIRTDDQKNSFAFCSIILLLRISLLKAQALTVIRLNGTVLHQI